MNKVRLYMCESVVTNVILLHNEYIPIERKQENWLFTFIVTLQEPRHTYNIRVDMWNFKEKNVYEYMMIIS